MSRQFHYSRATFGANGVSDTKDIVNVSYGYTKIKPTVNGATTVSLNHNVPAGAQMYIVKRPNARTITGAGAVKTMEAVASYTTPTFPANSVATLTTPLAAGNSYTVHYLITSWQLDPTNDMTNWPDNDK